MGRLCICTGTGNNGNDALHTGGRLTQGESQEVELGVGPYEPTLNVQLWKVYEDEIVSGACALLMQWGIVNGNAPFLFGEKVKTYLRRGARFLTGYTIYPNDEIGWGILCVRDSLPE